MAMFWSLQCGWLFNFISTIPGPSCVRRWYQKTLTMILTSRRSTWKLWLVPSASRSELSTQSAELMLCAPHLSLIRWALISLWNNHGNLQTEETGSKSKGVLTNTTHHSLLWNLNLAFANPSMLTYYKSTPPRKFKWFFSKHRIRHLLLTRFKILSMYELLYYIIHAYSKRYFKSIKYLSDNFYKNYYIKKGILRNN